MYKTYNFLPSGLPSNPIMGKFNLTDNVLSTYKGTLKDVFDWARYILKFHPTSDYVEFMVEGGRKIHRVERT